MLHIYKLLRHPPLLGNTRLALWENFDFSSCWVKVRGVSGKMDYMCCSARMSSRKTRRDAASALYSAVLFANGWIGSSQAMKESANFKTSGRAEQHAECREKAQKTKSLDQAPFFETETGFRPTPGSAPAMFGFDGKHGKPLKLLSL